MSFSQSEGGWSKKSTASMNFILVLLLLLMIIIIGLVVGLGLGWLAWVRVSVG